MITLIYHLFGTTLTAGYVRCFLAIASYSAMYAMIPWFAGRVGVGKPAGVLGGIAGALIPQQSLGEVIGWSASEPLAAIALGLLLVGFAALDRDTSFLIGFVFVWNRMGRGVSFCTCAFVGDAGLRGIRVVVARIAGSGSCRS
jgi:hypothetical protein